MERITITIDMENSAFDNSPMTEVARILRKLARKAEREGLEDAGIMDLNGNVIGDVKVEIGHRRFWR